MEFVRWYSTPDSYASWTLLLGLWAPGHTDPPENGRGHSIPEAESVDKGALVVLPRQKYYLTGLSPDQCPECDSWRRIPGDENRSDWMLCPQIFRDINRHTEPPVCMTTDLLAAELCELEALQWQLMPSLWTGQSSGGMQTHHWIWWAEYWHKSDIRRQN